MGRMALFCPCPKSSHRTTEMQYFVPIRYGILSTQRPQPDRLPMRDDQQPDGLAEYVRCFGWPNPPAGGPRRPCGARAEGRAPRGRPRPEAQPARARPQAGARGCAEPEEQGDTAQPVTAALLLRRVCRSRCGQADRIAVLQLFRFCADTLPTERCEFVLLSPSYYIK